MIVLCEFEETNAVFNTSEFFYSNLIKVRVKGDFIIVYRI